MNKFKTHICIRFNKLKVFIEILNKSAYKKLYAYIFFLNPTIMLIATFVSVIPFILYIHTILINLYFILLRYPPFDPFNTTYLPLPGPFSPWYALPLIREDPYLDH